MKNLLFILLLLVSAQLTQAQSFKGQQVPKQHKAFFESLISLSGDTYMSKYEISNQDYRKFMHWVRDSVAHAMLGHIRELPEGQQKIDWEQELDWRFGSDLYLSSFDNLWTWLPAQYNPSLFVWTSPTIDSVGIYPDTTLWAADFNYAYMIDYFNDPAYKDYPVVGITAQQAAAYCEWKQMRLGEAGIKVQISLPTEQQWLKATNYKLSAGVSNAERAALFETIVDGEIEYSLADPDTELSAVANSNVNEAGFYGMLGNVAEWTNADGKMIAKGGHWKSGEWSTETVTDPKDGKGKISVGFPARTYIGFRVVVK